MLRIVTDGAGDILPSWGKEYGIDIIPVNILFGEKSYLQGVELDNEGFYRMVEENRKIPKTSQPSPHQFVEFYRKVAQKGDTILSIHITAKLSGTYASAIAAAEEVKDDFKVIPIDSALGSLGIGLLCREARKMARAGKSVDEIVNYIEGIKNRVRVILTLDTLEYAKMSGRVKTLQAALASVLNVKPIAILREGDLSMAERVRTRKASLDRVIEIGREATDRGSRAAGRIAVRCAPPRDLGRRGRGGSTHRSRCRPSRARAPPDLRVPRAPFSEAMLSLNPPQHHTIAGNKIRLERRMVLRVDEAWRQHLSPLHLRIFGWLAGAENRRLGYSGR